MGAFSIWHLLIVLMVILVVFGAGRLPSVMGDMAKGVKAFKKGMADEEPPVATNKDKEIANHS
jgi:sec-independent protein translocase protein TatA